MPDLQKIIEIVFQGTDNVGDSVVSVSKGLDVVAGKAQAVTGPLADITDVVVKANLAVGAMGAAFLGFAFNESVKFESAVLDLQKVLGESEGAVDQYIPKIDDLASTYGVASENVVAAAANFRQSGFEISESLNLTDLALKAVKISELEADEASALLISTLSGFDAEAGDATRVLDILNAVSNKYAASVGELGRGMADLSPIAKAANLSFEETAGLLTPIVQIFGSGSEAAQALKTALLRLGSDTKPVQEALAALKVSQTDANGALRQSGDILEDLAGVWPGLTQAQQSYYAAELAGINQAPKFQAALGNYEIVLGATEVALGAAGSAQAEWEVRMNAAEEVINRTVQSFKGLLRVVGDQYRDEMAGAIGATGDLAAEFSALVRDGGLEPLFAQLRPLLTGIEDDLRAIATALPAAFKGLDLATVLGGFESLGAAVSTLFDGADITTAKGLESVLQDLVNIGGGFLQVTAGIVDAIAPAVRALAEMGSEFGELGPGAQNAAGEILGVGKVADVLLGLVSPVSGGLESIGFGMQAIAASSVVKTLSGATTGFAAMAAALGVGAAALGSWVFAYQEMSAAVDDYNARNEAYRRAVEGVAETEGRRAESLEAISDKLGLVIPNMAEFNQLAKDGAIIFDEATGTWVRAADAVTKHSDALSAADVQAAIDLEKEFNAAVAEEARNLEQADDALLLRSQRFQEEAKWTLEVVDGVNVYTQAIGSKTAAVEKDTSAIIDAAAESENFRLELLKLASDERIKNIEARVSLETAELEASTAVTIAAFESIDNTITSTGDLLGKLFGELNNAESIRDKWTIEDQIKIENELRAEAAELQGNLTREQIKYLQARTAAMARGDALITIEGDGLEPELEAFMWKILERIQVRATTDGADFLLGVT